MQLIIDRPDYNPQEPELFIWSTVEPLAIADSALSIVKAIYTLPDRQQQFKPGLRAALNILAARARK